VEKALDAARPVAVAEVRVPPVHAAVDDGDEHPGAGQPTGDTGQRGVEPRRGAASGVHLREQDARRLRAQRPRRILQLTEDPGIDPADKGGHAHVVRGAAGQYVDAAPRPSTQAAAARESAGTWADQAERISAGEQTARLLNGEHPGLL
jgi:hypothetical protein